MTSTAAMTIPEALAPSLLAEGYRPSGGLSPSSSADPESIVYTKAGSGIDVEFFPAENNWWMAIHICRTQSPDSWWTVFEAEVRNPIHGRALLWAMSIIGANRPGPVVARGEGVEQS